MDPCEVYQDFLQQYHLLLEAEKRRLNIVSDKSNNVTEAVETVSSGIIDETDETSCQIVEDNKSPEIGKGVVEQEQHVVHERDAECDDRKQVNAQVLFVYILSNQTHRIDFLQAQCFSCSLD